jgi:diphosphomevalonate decarboxylase
MAVMTTFNKVKSFDVESLVQMGSIHVSAPSNIALVKYWGKKLDQRPCNPSLSMTLEKSRTYLSLEFTGRSYLKDELIQIDYFFEGERNDSFSQKIHKYLSILAPSECPYLPYFDLKISSYNTFPHSAGIASSASSMAAIAYALVLLEQQVFSLSDSQENQFKRISHLARLGSGSASRSIEGPYCQWGLDSQGFGNDDYAVGVTQIHSLFNQMNDSILIIDDQVKAVSSTQGHQLMENHPYREARFARAESRVRVLKTILEQGDWKQFCELVEGDALELHGLMMSSTPAYILMRPKTLEAIEKIQWFQKKTSPMLTFTLDAGANLHVLYPQSVTQLVKDFLESELSPLCVEGRMIHDSAGLGLRLETGL